MTPRTLVDIDPESARALVDEGSAVLIDIREPDEHARERIPQARNVPLSRFEASTLPRGEAPIAIFHCRSGARTAEAAQRLLASGFAEVRCLDGGIEAWKKAGLPVEVDRGAPLPLMRQVQIGAGSLVLLGAVLAWLVSPWFILMCAFVGAGLVVAGVTGFCGMARMLAAMPWNRRPAGSDRQPVTVH